MKGPKPVQMPFQSSSTISYGQIAPQDTPDIKALRDTKLEVDPSVGFTYGSAKRRLSESFNNPLGSYTTPAIREATERSALGDLTQQEGAATQEASFQNAGLDLARKQALAEMTQNRILQTGGNQAGFNSQFAPQQPSILGQVAGGAAQGLTQGLAM